MRLHLALTSLPPDGTTVLDKKKRLLGNYTVFLHFPEEWHNWKAICVKVTVQLKEKLIVLCEAHNRGESEEMYRDNMQLNLNYTITKSSAPVSPEFSSGKVIQKFKFET